MRERRWTPRPSGPAGRKPAPRPGYGPKRPFRPRRQDADGPVLLYGWHTVKAALENPRRHFRRLLATENAARRLAEDCLKLSLSPELVRPDAIAEQLPP